MYVFCGKCHRMVSPATRCECGEMSQSKSEFLMWYIPFTAFQVLGIAPIRQGELVHTLHNDPTEGRIELISDHLKLGIRSAAGRVNP